ncbi:Hypothetical protein CAP_3698 [Chondromyces apiculatus DSM 436]|uniref:Uncharacterized protein n=1 Tax=Chondromyces apiculatus DSM 436 TaxID=1192034 RepID=A0A017T7A3_9BACT|nr:Hypothetical protein CAP_3698 [Chondromyces apiculatus DSM 436]
MGVEGMALLNVLPAITYGIAPTIELSLSRRAELRASALVSGTATTSVESATAESSLIAGRLDACAAGWPRDLIRLRACAGLLAGAVNASGLSVPDPRTAVSPWITPALRLDATWHVARPLGLVLGVDGYFPGLRPELQIVDAEGTVVAARRFPLAGVGISLGALLALW